MSDLARLTERPAGTLRFGLATIDMNGRVADAALFRVLGWTTDTRLHIQTCTDLVVVADDRGVFRLRPPGHVRIPATAQHWCRLELGDRVLLAADPVNGLLVVHPPAVLEELVGGLLRARFRDGGE
ncbi:AbrB/MazE/SpoVT family DNA-binding domain-containing protein [Dactylosporangium sp. NPDC051484]|uniref:AbrB/MazE/SpoVT family DNA-binding domain-containing protein n=1 Tax=Dactylosporangium sp. NPDC051484 TaxID=3154942 RepID=UPI00344CF4F3